MITVFDQEGEKGGNWTVGKFLLGNLKSDIPVSYLAD